MSFQIEKLENNMAKLTITVSAEEFNKAVTAAYKKQKNQFSIPGFRKGKVPQNMIEKMYGPGVFYEEACNSLIPTAYSEAFTECGEDIVSRPEIDLVQVEKGKDFIFTAEVALKPEVTLGEYKGVEVTAIPAEPTEDEIQAEIDRELNSNSRIVAVEDRPIADGDTAVIDYEGFVDGVAFEGGKGENHSLVIGSATFIPGFEEQLIGKNAGDETEVNVTFPEEYHSADLAGKDATFKVKIHEIKVKEVPAFDEDFVQDVSEFDTVEEYKADVAKKVAEKKAADIKREQEEEAIEIVANNATMDIPEAMIDTQADEMINNFAQQLSMQGLSFDQYLQFTGGSIDALKEQVRPDAERNIKKSLVLEAVAKAENIEITEEEIDAEIARMAEMYNMEADKIKGMMGDDEIESMKTDLSVQKAVEVISSSMVPVEKAADAE